MVECLLITHSPGTPGIRRRIIMRNTSLCYIENRDRYLMMHRVKKKNDENAHKWIGIGGKFEEGESPEECASREIFEETGLTLNAERLLFRGIVTFVSDEWGTEYMHLFTCSISDVEASGLFDKGGMRECSEGTLEWVGISDVPALPVWEGDRIFLRYLAGGEGFFSLKLEYSGDRLVKASRSGKALD